MEPSVVIILSSSPPPMATSQDAPRNNETAKKIATSGHGLCTPTKDHNDIWKMPSSSPLPSPGALLRGLLQPKARSGGQGKIGKSFKTASELLETEEQRGHLLFGVNENQHTKEYAAIVPEEITTRAKSSITAKKRAPRKTVAKPEKAVKRAATVSSHFSKKSKTSNAGKGSKALSSVEQTNIGNHNTMVSMHTDVTKPMQERSKDTEAGLDEAPMPPVPTRRRDWTPVRNTVPVVEITSSPMVWRTEYEADLGEAELKDFTTGTTDESASSKRRFGDKIGLFKFDLNSTSTGPLGSTLGTTKRCIQMLDKPQLTRSISSLSGSTKSSGKRGRKKAETITGLATTQYRTEKEDKPQSPSVVDFLTKWSPEATLNDTEPQAKKRKRHAKSKGTTEGKKLTNRRVGRKASKEEVDETVELLSPQSAIRRTNEQQIIFGTFSQLVDGKVDTPPDTEAPGLQKSSSAFNHRISTGPQFGGLTKVGSPKRTNALKREGLWEAASRNNDIGFMGLSETPKIDNEELEMVEQKTRRRNSQVRKSGSVTPEIEDSAKKSATPPMKKRKKAGASDIVPGKGKKSKGKPTEPTAGSPQSKKTTKGERATSPAKSKGKTRAKSSSPFRKSRRSKSPSVSAEWPTASPSQANNIHSYISKAIRAEYRSTNDIVNSWHYKILTYEPIILEDFTIWLNTVGLGNVGMDNEVSPFIVKAWAEARSVVNVWRETQRGTDRKRF